MIHVTVHLKTQSQPIEYSGAINTYTKDGFYCVYTGDEVVHKYPMADIFRVIEEYGFHGRSQDE